MPKRKDMTIPQRIAWLESMISVYGFLLAQKGLTIEQALRNTIGNALWLDGVNDQHWRMLWDEIVPVLLRHAHGRGELVSWKG